MTEDEMVGWHQQLSGHGFERAGSCPAAPLASIRQMSRQVSRGSAGEYQADEPAGVAHFPIPCLFPSFFSPSYTPDGEPSDTT